MTVGKRLHEQREQFRALVRRTKLRVQINAILQQAAQLREQQPQVQEIQMKVKS